MESSPDGLSKPSRKIGEDITTTAPEKSPTSRLRPIPEAFKHIDINFCKTPGCDNFGVLVRKGRILTGTTEKDAYRLVGDSSKSTSIQCYSCRHASRVKSNKAIFEEYDRQRSGLIVVSPLCCPDESCANHAPPSGESRDLFRRYGKTHSGSDRWQCRLCKKTFSIGKATKGHKKPHTNAAAFELIINKVSIRRMAEILDLSFASVYGKIDFIHDQCRMFAASRENSFRELALRRLYLSTDRQDYMVNWGSRKARQTIQLTAIATSDQVSGYVFGLTPNYDASIDPAEVEADWLKCGDAALPVALRKYARIWTQADYARSLARSAESGDDENVSTRDDLDAPELLSTGQQLPVKGAQVHADYLMHGHYWFLRDLFRVRPKTLS